MLSVSLPIITINSNVLHIGSGLGSMHMEDSVHKSLGVWCKPNAVEKAIFLRGMGVKGANIPF